MKSKRLVLLCFIILFASMMTVVVPTHDRPLSVQAVDTWWNMDWQYRKSFDVSGQTSTESNYQVEIIIHRSAGSDSGNEVYLSTKCESDYDDIRFTNDEASPTVLDYWIENSDSSDARIWVELDSITASSTDTFYLYYGYASAPAYSNGTDTFGIEFQDFDTDDAYYTGSSVNIDEGTDERVEWTSDAMYGDAEEATPASTGGELALEFTFDYSGMGGFSNARVTYGDTLQSGWSAGAGLDGVGATIGYGGRFYIYVIENGVSSQNGSTGDWSVNTQYWARVTLDGGTATATLYSDYWDTVVCSYEITSVSFNDNPDTMTYQNRDRTGCTGWVDDVRIRHWVDEDPQASNWGSEAEPNKLPTNSATPTCTNIDDTNNLYARYKKYEITSQVTDPDGYADIDYVELSLMELSTQTTYWKIRYDEDTDTFTEETNPTYIELDTTGSVATESGTTIDITWKLYIEWIHPDVTGRDLRQYVIDSVSNTDTDDYTVLWDVETRLDGTFALNDYSGTALRGTIDGDITAYGVFYYYGGGGDDYAPSDEVDVWVSCASVATSPWSDTILSEGVYSMTVQADDVVGQVTYTCKPVAEGAGSGGDSLFYTSNPTSLYTSDQIKVVSYSVPSGDTRVTINDDVYIRLLLVYDYDKLNVTTGDVTVNGVSASQETTTDYWGFTVSKSSVQAFTYDTVAASGNTHGVNSVNQNGQSQQVIWDRVQVQSYTVTDTRVNINDNVNIDALLWYDYDDTLVTDGTVTINAYSAAHQGSGVWRITRTSATVGDVTYNDVQCTGNTHGITVTDQNGQSETVIWDRIIVIDLTYGGDTRIDAGTSVNFDYELHYDYDETDVTDGNVQASGYTFTHQGNGIWRYTTDNGGVVGYIHFDTVVCWDNTHGITEEYQNGKSVTLIWDRIQVQSYTVTDTRVNINDNVNIDALLWYDYDDNHLTDGTVTINGYSATYQGSGIWRITRTSATVGDVTYNDVQCTGNTYGITVEDQNGKSVMVIWDRIVVTITNTNYYKLPLNVNASQNGSPVTVTVIYDYDDTVFDGTVTLNDTTWVYATAGWRGYTAASVSGGTHGITAFTSNEISILWQDVTVSWNHFWSQYNENAFAHMSATNMKWSIEGSYIPAASLIDFIRNTSTIYTGSPSNGQIADIVCLFDTTWRYVEFKLNITYTVAPYYFNDYQFKVVGDEVPTWHTLFIEVFDHGLTDYYFSFFVETNWHNACTTVYVDGAKEAFFTSEGWHQFSKPTSLGVHNITILVNGTGPALEANQYYGLGDGDGWDYRWMLIEVEAETTLFFYFRDLNNLPIPWGSEQQPFIVYVNGTRVASQGYWIRQDFNAINLTIVDYWGYTLYTSGNYTVQTIGDTTIDIQLIMWRIYLVNQKDFGVYAVITFNSANQTYFLGKGGISLIHVYNSTYTVSWYEQDNGNFINSETRTLTSDYAFFTARQPKEPDAGGDDPWKWIFYTMLYIIQDALIVVGIIVVVGIFVTVFAIAWLRGSITSTKPKLRGF